MKKSKINAYIKNGRTYYPIRSLEKNKEETSVGKYRYKYLSCRNSSEIRKHLKRHYLEILKERATKNLHFLEILHEQYKSCNP